jgi:hypothetical protein
MPTNLTLFLLATAKLPKPSTTEDNDHKDTYDLNDPNDSTSANQCYQ